jgi:hypothetical protein
MSSFRRAWITAMHEGLLFGGCGRGCANGPRGRCPGGWWSSTFASSTGIVLGYFPCSGMMCVAKYISAFTEQGGAGKHGWWIPLSCQNKEKWCNFEIARLWLLMSCGLIGHNRARCQHLKLSKYYQDYKSRTKCSTTSTLRIMRGWAKICSQLAPWSSVKEYTTVWWSIGKNCLSLLIKYVLNILYHHGAKSMPLQFRDHLFRQPLWKTTCFSAYTQPIWTNEVSRSICSSRPFICL